MGRFVNRINLKTIELEKLPFFDFHVNQGLSLHRRTRQNLGLLTATGRLPTGQKARG